MFTFSIGLCTSNEKIHASIIITGDPMQLDAVTKSRQAIELGFQTSFLENLCKRKLYKHEAKTKKYRSEYITQLIRNYRSHPDILKIPNDLFYSSKLLAEASEGSSNTFQPNQFTSFIDFKVISRYNELVY